MVRQAPPLERWSTYTVWLPPAAATMYGAELL
jgi:hypothetical protein